MCPFLAVFGHQRHMLLVWDSVTDKREMAPRLKKVQCCAPLPRVIVVQRGNCITKGTVRAPVCASLSGNDLTQALLEACRASNNACVRWVVLPHALGQGCVCLRLSTCATRPNEVRETLPTCYSKVRDAQASAVDTVQPVQTQNGK